MLVTQIASSCSALTWMATEWYMKDYPTILGMVSGAVAGLVAITPAAGFVDQTGAFVIGAVCGPVCYFGVQLKHAMGFEDALDAFGTHAIAGALGGILTGCFARAEIGGTNGAFYGHPRQLLYQLAGVFFSMAWSAVISFILLMVIDKAVGLRIRPEDELDDLDASIHAGGSVHGVQRNDDLQDTIHGQGNKASKKRSNAANGDPVTPIIPPDGHSSHGKPQHQEVQV